MGEFIGRWFTPSKSDKSGMVAPLPNKPGPKVAELVTKKARRTTQSRYAGAAQYAKEAETTRKMLLGE